MRSDLTAAQLEELSAELNRQLRKLQRVAAGTYGSCVVCGAPIAFERLMVFPEAPNCVACTAR
jgi:DnaK suppressor protein